MKKISLTVFAIAFAINFSYAQWSTGTGTVYPTTTTDKVGIGTTSPLSQLQVANATATNTSQTFARFGRTTGANNGIGDYIGIGPNAVTTIGAVYRSTDAWGLEFLTYDVTGIRLNGNGNVGIGTTSPGSQLDVENSQNAATLIQVGNSNSGASAAGALVATNGTHVGLLQQYGTSYTTSGIFRQDGTILYANGSGGLTLSTGFAQPIYFATNSTQAMIINSSGYVGIGTSNPDQKLTVKGTIHSQEVIVDMSVLPDYVFKPTYRLPTLTEVKTYIDQNHHLPEMPSAEQVAKDGLSLGDMNAKLLKKVEELTLYLIEKDTKDKIKDEQLNSQKEISQSLQKEITDEKTVNQSLQKQIDELKKQVSTLIKSKP